MYTEANKLLRKIVAVSVLVPLAIIIIAFAVANRQIVTVSLDPLSSGEPAATVTMPLFALVIATLIVGVVVGGVAAWLRQSKWRRVARRLEREASGLRAKLDAYEGDASRSGIAPREHHPPQPLKLRPPAR